MGLYAVKTNENDDAKILRAFGLKWQIGRDATPEEISAMFAGQLADEVFKLDAQENSQAFKDTARRIETAIGKDAVADVAAVKGS